MNLESIHIVYFLGIGGIGMSALARWFNHQGIVVAGYDRMPTSLTDALMAEGITIHFEDNIKTLPEALVDNKDRSLVVYTPAIPTDHRQYNYLLSHGYTLIKRSAVLGKLTESMFSIAVAGTHGKTTTSSMVAHILKEGGKNCAAFLGGIAQNYDSNMLLGTGEGENLVVVEADEFDRSFLALSPNIAVITSADADHLDIYGHKDELVKSFQDFAAKTHEEGVLFVQEAIQPVIAPVETAYETVSYGLKQGDIKAENLSIKGVVFHFDVRLKGRILRDFQLHVPGFHNVENALAAIAVADYLDMPEASIRSALATYRGVKRRFEFVIQQLNLTFIDDYAHHPVEIEAFLTSVRALYPGRKLTAIFQPHLYSRTRDFADEFAKSLSLADEVLMLDIYPARELPIEGVDVHMIFDKIIVKEKMLMTKEEVMQKIREMKIDVLVTIGAGDIDKMVKPIQKILSQTL